MTLVCVKLTNTFDLCQLGTTLLIQKLTFCLQDFIFISPTRKTFQLLQVPQSLRIQILEMFHFLLRTSEFYSKVQSSLNFLKFSIQSLLKISKVSLKYPFFFKTRIKHVKCFLRGKNQGIVTTKSK